MAAIDVSRREVLTGISAAALGGLTLGTGTANAEDTGRHVVGTSTSAATDAAERKADSVRHVLDFGDIGQAVAGRFSERALDELERNPNVRYVETDTLGEAIGESLPWGIDRVDAEVAHGNGETGGDDTDGEGGADIAIIDTGIDSDHGDLDDNLSTGKAVVECEPLSERSGCMFGVGSNDNPCYEPWDDDYDHGSHVSGTADAEDNTQDVIGISTNATLHAVKVCDQCGYCSASDTAKGIKWAADQGHDVENISLGWDDPQSVLKDAVQHAYDTSGVLIAAAAGNDGPCTDCVGYPAAYEECIAVSATSKDDTLADFSSTGPEIELAAPGDNITSTTPEGTETWDGTSMASPHVAGAGGQLMDNGYSNTDARTQLQDTAEDIGLSSNEQGHGLVDVAAALGLDSSDDLSENSAPSVSWNNPSDGATVAGDVDIDISASDSDGSVSTVEWKYEGGSWTEISDSDGDGTYDDTWDSTSVSDGTYTLYARATDDDGATSQATISVTVDNTDSAPSVSWANPTDGDTVSGTVTIQIDADDDRDDTGTLNVDYEVDNSGTWRETTYNSDTGYYEDSWDTTDVGDGDHTLEARAEDSSGNKSYSQITVTVDNTSSSPTIDTHAITEAGSPNPHLEITVDWGVSDGDGDLSRVEITAEDADGSAFGDTHTYSVSGSSASGTDDFKFKHVDGETADVTIYVEDSAGNSASHTEPVTE